MAAPRSTAMQQVLSHLAANGFASSAQIAKATNLGPASLYPALSALEYDGLIASGWDDMPPPRRRVYSLTPTGREKVGEMSPATSAPKAATGNWFWQKFVAPWFGG
jgi:DNA-binding PadR family transcriptional regulator